MVPPDDFGQDEVNTEVEDTTTDVANEQTADDSAVEASATEETEEPADGESEEDPASGEEDGDEEEGEGEPEAPKLNTKFKAGVYNKETRVLEQKEYEIDKRFHALMKDPEAEKAIRELHEKAYGLDSIKDRFAESRVQSQQLQTENVEIKKSIDDLRGIYTSAVETGNYHKLDGFFKKLSIPQDVILNYALAKVQLNEMDPAQRQVVQGQIEAEQRAEEFARQRDLNAQTLAAQTQQFKQMQLETTLNRVEVSPLAQEFDTRFGKPGAFREECIREGQLAWFTSKQDLTPEQAVQAVINKYNLTTLPMVPGAAKNAPVQNGAAGAKKAVVHRQTGTIPNVQGRSASPLKQKPKSMEDLMKYRKEQHGF